MGRFYLKGFYYELLSKRKLLFKVIIIICLVSLTSFVVALLPQLINPHILSKHLSGLSGDNEISAKENIYPDIDFHGHTKNPSFIDDFNQTVEKASLDVFGIVQLKNLNLYTLESAIYLNKTPVDSSYNRAVLVGISTSLYNSLKAFSTDNISSSGAMLLTEFENETLSTYQISVNEKNTTVCPNKIITYDNFNSNFPYFSYDFMYEISYWPTGAYNTCYYPCFFFQIDEYIAHFDDLIIQNNKYYDHYNLNGYLKFEEYQAEIVAWSIDSKKLLENFQTEIQINIQILEPSAELSFLNVYIWSNNELVGIIYSFIHGLQITIWCFSLFIIVIAIGKMQDINRNKKLRILFSGQKWTKRLICLFLESFLSVVLGVGFALLLIYPFLQFQSLFNMELVLTQANIIDFSIVSIALFGIIFAVFLDYEFYLHRLIYKQSEEERYKPFRKVPKYLYLVLILLVFLVLWLVNRNLILLLVFAIFVIISLVICYLVVLFTRLLVYLSKKLYYYRKKKEDQQISPLFALLKMWKNKLNSKLLVYTLMLTIISIAFLYANFNADAQRTFFLSATGGEIELQCSPLNTTEIELNLQNISEIIDYTKLANFYQFSNSTSSYDFALIDDEITIVNDTYEGDRIFCLTGINVTDYLQFFKDWNKRSWLTQGKPQVIAENQIYVSSKFQEIGFNQGDSINILNNSLSFSIEGFIDVWPGITYSSSDSLRRYSVIMDHNLLVSILEDLQFDYSVYYKIHTSEKNINSTVEKIVPMISQLGVDEIYYLDPEVFSGIRHVFLRPIIVVVQLFILLWISLFIYSNIDGIYQNSDPKNLGVIAFNSDFQKPLKNYLLIEGFIIFSAFLILFGFLQGLSVIFLTGFGGFMGMKIMIISRYTLLNILFLLLSYPVLLLVQGLVEYFNLRRINLSLIYRHLE